MHGRDGHGDKYTRTASRLVSACALLSHPKLCTRIIRLQKAFNEVAGDKEYSTTGWVEGAEAVQAAAVAPTPAPLASVAGLKPYLLRRASYSGTMMGSKVCPLDISPPCSAAC